MLRHMQEGSPEFPCVFQTHKGSSFRTWAFRTHQIFHKRHLPTSFCQFIWLPKSLDSQVTYPALESVRLASSECFTFPHIRLSGWRMSLQLQGSNLGNDAPPRWLFQTFFEHPYIPPLVSTWKSHAAYQINFPSLTFTLSCYFFP